MAGSSIGIGGRGALARTGKIIVDDDLTHRAISAISKTNILSTIAKYRGR